MGTTWVRRTTVAGRQVQRAATTNPSLAVIVGWVCFFFLTLDLVLLIMAGLRYRKQASELHNGSGSPTREYNDDFKNGSSGSTPNVAGV